MNTILEMPKLTPLLSWSLTNVFDTQSRNINLLTLQEKSSGGYPC